MYCGSVSASHSAKFSIFSNDYYQLGHLTGTVIGGVQTDAQDVGWCTLQCTFFVLLAKTDEILSRGYAGSADGDSCETDAGWTSR